MLDQVKGHKVSEQTLLKRLTDYVERIDTDLVRPLGYMQTLHVLTSAVLICQERTESCASVRMKCCCSTGVGVSDAAGSIRGCQRQPVPDAKECTSCLRPVLPSKRLHCPIAEPSLMNVIIQSKARHANLARV